MKKTLTILSLVIVIAMSILAGTLAVYTVDTPDYNSGDIVAKEFVFTTEGDANFGDTVKIAPTETVTKSFTVANFKTGITAETDMTVTIVVKVQGGITPLQITVDGYNNSSTAKFNVIDKNTVEITVDLLADTQTTETFTVSVKWPSTEFDNNYIGKKSSINVDAIAVQKVA